MRPVMDRATDSVRAADSERGTVTAEFAIVLPAVILVLVAVLTIAAAAGAQMRSADAARAAARVAAIGDDDDAVRTTAQQVAGKGAKVTIHRDPPWVEVKVATSVAGSWLSSFPLQASASAVAWVEP